MSREATSQDRAQNTTECAARSASAVSASRHIDPLYWSLRGEVACALHAPGPQSPRWAAERWAEVPTAMRNRQGIRYQCQHCADSKTPIVHQRLNTHAHQQQG